MSVLTTIGFEQSLRDRDLMAAIVAADANTEVRDILFDCFMVQDGLCLIETDGYAKCINCFAVCSINRAQTPCV